MRFVLSRFAAATALLASLAPAVSRAQSAPSAPAVAHPAHVATAHHATPQAGRQVPVPTATRPHPPPYVQPSAPPHVVPFAPPDVPASMGAQPFYPPQKEIRSVGSIIGGTVLATVGAFPLVGGLVITAHGTDQGIDYPIVGVPMAALGAVLVGSGIGLIVWGSGEDWVPGREASAVPIVRVGATAGSAQWVF